MPERSISSVQRYTNLLSFKLPLNWIAPATILDCTLRKPVFKYMRIAFRYLTFQGSEKKYGPWSIGVYDGSTPLNLSEPADIINPVLTGKDVNDIDAVYVADPFVLTNNDKWLIFFEVMNRESNKGEIGYAESLDGNKWKYKKIIINEKFHLSYPYVFKWNNSFYLVPESHEDFSVRLYKATIFPEKWEYVGNLLSGYRFADPSIFRFNDYWWMFVSTSESDVLNLYFSENLLNGWTSHPMNPIVKSNKHISRPAGRIINYNEKLYRLAQDDDPTYGMQVFAFEIILLSLTSYEEKLFSKTPVVTKTGKGWNASGMHHIDPHKIEKKWIAVVDAKGL